jgi:hypothetical protein
MVVGVNELTVIGKGAPTVKSLAETAISPPAVSSMRAVVAPVGTVTRTWVAESTTKLAPMLPTRAALTVLMPVPVTVTTVPTGPLAGANEVIDRVGAGATAGAGAGESLPHAASSDTAAQAEANSGRRKLGE